MCTPDFYNLAISGFICPGFVPCIYFLAPPAPPACLNGRHKLLPISPPPSPSVVCCSTLAFLESGQSWRGCVIYRNHRFITRLKFSSPVIVSSTKACLPKAQKNVDPKFIVIGSKRPEGIIEVPGFISACIMYGLGIVRWR